MFSDALDREATWLRTSTNDGLPNLLRTNGGPWDIIQARWPRSPSTSKPGIYVLRQPGQSGKITRFADIRTRYTTHFLLRLHWPMRNGTGSGETEQLAFEQAIDLLLTRLQDLPQDHTHAGRFLSICEYPGGIDIDIDDPEHARTQGGAFTGRITYSGDDPDYFN